MDPSATVTVGQVVSVLRDGVFISGICITGWKARDWFQPIFDFFRRANLHMDNMENGMQKLLSNHLSHIENDLKHLSGRRFDYAVVEEVVPDNDQDYKTL